MGGWRIFLYFCCQTEGIFRRTIWENMKTRVTRRISPPLSLVCFAFFLLSRKTCKERIRHCTKGVGWRLVREDWFKKATNHHYCSLSLSLCAQGIRCSLSGLPLTFMEKVFRTAIKWLLMGRASTLFGSCSNIAAACVEA